MTACRFCDGRGRVGPVHVNTGDEPHYWLEDMACFECGGSGQWSDERLAAWERGQQMRAARIARRETTAAMADRLGITAAELSGIERGREPKSESGRLALSEGSGS